MVAATRGKPESLGRKIAGFGIGLQVCATGWQRPGKPLFFPVPMDTATGKGPFHAHATAQNRAQKKEFPLRNADHKKRLCPPVRKKPAFLVGLYSWCSLTSWRESLTRARIWKPFCLGKHSAWTSTAQFWEAPSPWQRAAARRGEGPFFYRAMAAYTSAKRPPLHAENFEKRRYKKGFGGTTTGEKAASAQRLAAFN